MDSLVQVDRMIAETDFDSLLKASCGRLTQRVVSTLRSDCGTRNRAARTRASKADELTNHAPFLAADAFGSKLLGIKFRVSIT